MRNLFTSFLEELRRDKSYRATTSILIIRLIGIGFIFLNLLLLARFMGAKGFGDYIVIFTCIGFLVMLCLFGFHASIVKLYSSFAAEQKWNRLKGFLSFSKRTILLASLVSSLVILAVLLKNSARYGVTFSEALFWALLLLPFLAFIYYHSGVLLALRKVKTSLFALNVLLPVSATVACLLYYNMNNHVLKADAAVFIYLCCTIGVFIFVSGRLKRQFSRQLNDLPVEYAGKEWLSISFPALILSVTALTLKRADILFISYYFGNTHAGIYAVASMLSSLIPFLVFVPETHFIPRIRELFEISDHEKLHRMVRRSNKIMLMITLPVAGLLIVFGKFLLQLFGTAFIASYLPLIILTAGQLINIRTGLFAGILNEERDQKTVLFMYVLAAILNVVLNFILVPSLGMNGAAISSVLSFAALNGMMYFMVKKKFSIRLSVLIF